MQSIQRKYFRAGLKVFESFVSYNGEGEGMFLIKLYRPGQCSKYTQHSAVATCFDINENSSILPFHISFGLSSHNVAGIPEISMV